MQNGKQLNDMFHVSELDFFDVPRHLLAREPHEARGGERHDSRLLVLDRATNAISHSRVCDIGRYLQPGDIIVLNDSKTIPSVLSVRREGGGQVVLRLCSDRGGNIWHVQFESLRDLAVGFRVFANVEGVGSLIGEVIGSHDSVPGLYVMKLRCDGDLLDILHHAAMPVYSAYTGRSWGLEYYQNLHARTPGSVELPAAGRHFTPQLLDNLAAQDVQIAYITLHTGMSNLMVQEERVADHEMYDEHFAIDGATATQINEARARGGRLLAVGTTVMRALETIADETGQLKPFSGWTNLFIMPGYRFKIADMFLTNFHGPRTTRLALSMAFAGVDLVKRGYAEAIEREYLFYEFGDTTLTI